MKTKPLLLVLGTLLLAISVWWGISKDGTLEPWTAVLGAILNILGFISSPENKIKDYKTKTLQSNILSFYNSSKIRGVGGKIRQINIGGIGNKQDIEN